MTPPTRALTKPLEAHFAAFRQLERIRAGSLIISVFGDAIVPRGGRVWLGSLISLLAPLGLSERLVRTSVFRLTKEGWLDAERIGRKTDYVLTHAGRRRFEEASRHIYASSTPIWDRRWRLIVSTGNLASKAREQLRRALTWQGFGVLNPDTFVHPSADMTKAFDALVADGLGSITRSLKAFLAVDPQVGESADDQSLIRQAWDLDEMSEVYQTFVTTYAPILEQVLSSTSPISDEDAFMLRTLLIQDYRRSLLRDPELPRILLPEDWPGHRARAVCRELYRRILEASERHLDIHFSLSNGTAPEPTRLLQARFKAPDPLEP